MTTSAIGLNGLSGVNQINPWFSPPSSGLVSITRLDEQQTESSESEPSYISILNRLGSIGAGIRAYHYRLETTSSAHTLVREICTPYIVVPIRRTAAVIDQEVAEVESISSVIAEIKDKSGLNNSEVADLLGTTRTSVYAWKADKSVRLTNEINARSVLDVIRRAHRRLNDPVLVRAWLATPVGIRAEVPIILIKEGRADEARLMAMSALAKRDVALPNWVTEAPLNSWSTAQHERSSVVEPSPSQHSTFSGPGSDDE